jgi:polysaccharide biosynthesis/export protein
MPVIEGKNAPWQIVIVLVIVIAAGGCKSTQTITPAPVPKELEKVTHPTYRIEPPDIVQVELIGAVPKPPYHIRPLDVLSISVPGALPEAPISGLVTVETDGTINLGASYGSVAIAGMTLAEARAEIERSLTKFLKNNLVSIALAQTRGVQQVRGPHLVTADGTIALGIYGVVRVAGLTLPEAKVAIQEYLSAFFMNPEVALDIVGYNSKVYYVFYDGGGSGQQVQRFPITGNETVLDAVAQMNGLGTVSNKRHIWVSRPAPNCSVHQILPVDWIAISEQGDPATNYQLLPGDRVFVKAYTLTTVDTALARFISPIERLLGVTLLGSGVVNSINGNNGNGGGS